MGKKEKKYMHFSTQTHTQNMGQDNNSPPENVHNMMSGTLGQWVGKSRNTCTFQHKHTLKTWDKTTTHKLRMYLI